MRNLFLLCATGSEAYFSTHTRSLDALSRKFQHRKLFNLLHSSLQVGNINHTLAAGKVKCIHSLNAQLLDAARHKHTERATLSAHSISAAAAEKMHQSANAHRLPLVAPLCFRKLCASTSLELLL